MIEEYNPAILSFSIFVEVTKNPWNVRIPMEWDDHRPSIPSIIACRNDASLRQLLMNYVTIYIYIHIHTQMYTTKNMISVSPEMAVGMEEMEYSILKMDGANF